MHPQLSGLRLSERTLCLGSSLENPGSTITRMALTLKALALNMDNREAHFTDDYEAEGGRLIVL